MKRHDDLQNPQPDISFARAFSQDSAKDRFSLRGWNADGKGMSRNVYATR
jgi:hypothetical protein